MALVVLVSHHQSQVPPLLTAEVVVVLEALLAALAVLVAVVLAQAVLVLDQPEQRTQVVAVAALELCLVRLAAPVSS